MDEPDLFSASFEDRLASRAPLAERMRPRTLDEVRGQEHLLGPGAPLRRLIEADRVSSIILWGPPGTGKTTIAELVASTTRRSFDRLSAVSSGVKDIREVIESAKRRLSFEDKGSVVFVDEIHRFSTGQQDALLHAVETGLLTLVGATTENPAFSVNPALRSRSSVFALRPLSEEALAALCIDGASVAGGSMNSDAARAIARRCTGDARQALTTVELCCAMSAGRPVNIDDVGKALSMAVSRLGRDDHYDIASAFIKSMRAGETDVALHWLARMLESGEDPRFVARRLVIFASEDVGDAEPTALLVAVAAADALEKVGLPEARYGLAQAVVHLSLAPKSRRVADAIGSAIEDVRAGNTAPAPPSTAEPPGHRPVGFNVPRYYRLNPDA